MDHWLASDPGHQVGRVGGAHYVAERVVLPRVLYAFELGDEVQIVIAKHRDGALTQRTHEAKRFQGFRPAVDQIADEPEPVFRAEPDLAEQLLQLVEASLHVTDRIGRHRLRL
jgi:hypothetical protein